jgi:hypothetical protein
LLPRSPYAFAPYAFPPCIAALAVGAALFGLTALPAFAAPAAHPKVHTFTLPPVTGITVSGSYAVAGGKAYIRLCAKENAPDVDFAVAVATALNATATRHQAIEIEIAGSGKHECKSLVTRYTAHLYAAATSGTTNGKSHIGKLIKIR